MTPNNFYFKSRQYSFSRDVSNDYIYSSDLLSLIRDGELKEFLINKYSLEEDLKISIDKVDRLFDTIEDYTNRFELIRLNVKDDKVTSFLEIDPETDKDEYYFNIKEGVDQDGVIHESIKAMAIYDSLNLFYKGRNLSQYVRSLKNPNKNMKPLLEDLNNSWSRYFKNNEREAKERTFRLLKKEDKYFLKSINSDKYKEYGIAESFVIAMLELNKIQTKDPSLKFHISSVFLGESKIDLIISLNKKVRLEGAGFFSPSISIKNEDQGNTSLGVYNTLEFFPEKTQEGKIYLFPKKDDNKIKNSKSVTHTASLEKVVEVYESISDVFEQLENYADDFSFYKGSASADVLRHRIAERLCGNNSYFKGLFSLQDLFTKDKTKHIENLEGLLRICGEAEKLDLDYDIKSRLRYIISDVLLYGKTKY